MNFIFDFDGTICESFDITVSIINEYLGKRGMKLITSKEIKEIGLEAMLRRYKLNKLQILVFILLGRRKLSGYIGVLKTVPGLSAVIKKLSETNRLGIVSSNSTKNINKFLKNNKLDSYFEFVSSSPTFDKAKKINDAIRKYKMDRSETIYVGDEVRDIEISKKINIKIISVSWGFAGKNLLKRNGARILINDPKELLSAGKLLQH
ncbi:MAG TPA: HAD-IA family hydrolase [Candidatus Saccharimonadales bacterium]|nr:HAD-IA family hydrolase [Candidatus Saccharimonadales bacterium]